MADQHTPRIDFIDESLYPCDIESMDSLYTELQGVSFPISKSELQKQYGSKEIYWSDTEVKPLTTLLEALPDRLYSSLSDLSAEISQHSPE